MQEKTFYDLLEVSETASTEEIRLAFASKYRSFQVLISDPNPEKAEYAQRVLRLLADANTVLTDPEQRKNYDIAIQARRIELQNQQRQRQMIQNAIEASRQQQIQQTINVEVQRREQAIRENADRQVQALQQQKGCGNILWSAFAAPLLSGFCCGLIFLRNFGDAIWLGLLGVLLSLSGAITGLMPIVGQYFHYLLVYKQILPWWSNASSINGHWIITVMIVLSFINSIFTSIYIILAIIGIVSMAKNK